MPMSKTVPPIVKLVPPPRKTGLYELLGVRMAEKVAGPWGCSAPHQGLTGGLGGSSVATGKQISHPY